MGNQLEQESLFCFTLIIIIFFQFALFCLLLLPLTYSHSISSLHKRMKCRGGKNHKLQNFNIIVTIWVSISLWLTLLHYIKKDMNGNMFFSSLLYLSAHSAQRVTINTQNLFLLKPFASSAFRESRILFHYTHTFLPSSL